MSIWNITWDTGHNRYCSNKESKKKSFIFVNFLNWTNLGKVKLMIRKNRYFFFLLDFLFSCGTDVENGKSERHDAWRVVGRNRVLKMLFVLNYEGIIVKLRTFLLGIGLIMKSFLYEDHTGKLAHNTYRYTVVHLHKRRKAINFLHAPHVHTIHTCLLYLQTTSASTYYTVHSTSVEATHFHYNS